MAAHAVGRLAKMGISMNKGNVLTVRELAKWGTLAAVMVCVVPGALLFAGLLGCSTLDGLQSLMAS